MVLKAPGRGVPAVNGRLARRQKRDAGPVWEVPAHARVPSAPALRQRLERPRPWERRGRERGS